MGDWVQLEEEQSLMDSIYEAVADQAVSMVKDHFHDYGIDLVDTERYGLGRVGIRGCDHLQQDKLIAVIESIHPNLNEIRQLPSDLANTSFDLMNSYYQAAWCQPTPGGTPQLTPRMGSTLDMWQQQQRATAEIGSSVKLDAQAQEEFQRNLALKLDMSPTQVKVIVEAITPRMF